MSRMNSEAPEKRAGRPSKGFRAAFLAGVIALSVFPIGDPGLADAKTSRGGGAEGHGGGSVVCRDPISREVRSAVLLDLYEAVNQYGLAIPRVVPTGSTPIADDAFFEAALAGARARLDAYPSYANKVDLALTAVRLARRFVPVGTALAITDDYFPIVREKNCAIEQLAVFDDEGTLLIDSEIYAALAAVDRAALSLHEAAYKVDRDVRRSTDSRTARRLVGRLFAEPFDPASVAKIHALYVTTRFVPGMYFSNETACVMELAANPDEESFSLRPAPGGEAACPETSCFGPARRYLQESVSPAGFGFDAPYETWSSGFVAENHLGCAVRFDRWMIASYGYRVFDFVDANGQALRFARGHRPTPFKDVGR